MLIHSSRKVVDGNLTLKVGDRTVKCIRSFKFLGVNNTLTWADHIDMMCKKVSRSLNLLCRLSWFLPQPLLLLYLKSYILPHFDYCDVVWIGCTKAESLRLESLLNFACRTVLHRFKFSSSAAARCELGLSTLSSRRKFHLAQTVFKCLYSPCSSCLSQLFSTPSFSYHTRSSSSSQLKLPAPRLSYGQRAFSFALLWLHCTEQVQWILSIKDTLNLSNEDTVCCLNYIWALYKSTSELDTSLYRTASWVPVVSTIERFHCTVYANACEFISTQCISKPWSCWCHQWSLQPRTLCTLCPLLGCFLLHRTNRLLELGVDLLLCLPSRG